MSDPDPTVTTTGSHRCGRCRKTFSLEVDEAAIDWWVCDDCRAVLLPASVR